MKHYFLKAIGLVSCIGFFSIQAMAQQGENKEQLGQNDEIIIKKKGDKDTKVTVEIKNGEIKVNGKPLSEFEDDNVVIRKRKVNDGFGRLLPTPATPSSPFRGGTWNDDKADMNALRSLNRNSNRAFLGVMTDKDENGAKITSVTKESAAAKAGLQEGDIITKVDETKIEEPEDLIKAMGKFKPEDKVTITYKRGRKEQKASAILGKSTRATTIFPENFDFDKNFNFDINPEFDGSNYVIRGNNPRLGIKAQDTEDGKGVKVLNVADESNAQKAGINEGDILIEFDGKTVNSAAELSEAAKNAKDKNSIKVKFTRAGKTQEAEIKVPRKLKTANL